MRICAVCGFGRLGIHLQMNIEHPRRGGVTSRWRRSTSEASRAWDIFVTTNELFDNFPVELKDKTIVLSNFVDKASIKQAIDERIN